MRDRALYASCRGRTATRDGIVVLPCRQLARVGHSRNPGNSAMESGPIYAVAGNNLINIAAEPAGYRRTGPTHLG